GRFRRPFLLTPGVMRGAPRVLFIGRVPGQIYSWPEEAHPADWSPVWAVPMGRRGCAVYCGTDIDAAVPVTDQHNVEPHRLRRWKLTLWHRRKRIKEPAEPALA